MPQEPTDNKYTVSDVFDLAILGKPIDFESAVTYILAGKAAEAIEYMKNDVKSAMFNEPNDEPDLPSEEDDEDEVVEVDPEDEDDGEVEPDDEEEADE